MLTLNDLMRRNDAIFRKIISHAQPATITEEQLDRYIDECENLRSDFIRYGLYNHKNVDEPVAAIYNMIDILDKSVRNNPRLPDGSIMGLTK